MSSIKKSTEGFGATDKLPPTKKLSIEMHPGTQLAKLWLEKNFEK